jgi:DNA-binding GntR family transcriptional regulator
MRSRYEAGDLLGVSAGSTEMHRQLLKIARHQTAARLIDGLKAQNVRYLFRTILVPGRAGESVEEHAAILEAVASADSDRAEQLARRHVERIAEALRAVHGEPVPAAALI